METERFIVFQDRSGIAEYLAGFIAGKISSLPPGGLLNMALSGGNTPESIFNDIRLNHGRQINRDRIRYFQVDERCVPPDHPESNFRMIRNSLFDTRSFNGDRFFRIQGENDPERETGRYGEILRNILPADGNWPVFDLILLGLGNDGHTASIFPGDKTAVRSSKYCEVTLHPLTGQQRITLTLEVINHALCQIFLVTGREKAAIVADILQGAPGKKYPASLVRVRKGRQIWLLDSEAAGLLSATAAG